MGVGAGEADELVVTDVAVLRDLAFLDHLKGGVILQTGDKENAGMLQRRRELVASGSPALVPLRILVALYIGLKSVGRDAPVTRGNFAAR